MTSATEELRRLLDERGVEWSATVGANGTIWTHWDAFNGQRIHAMDNEDGTVEIFDQWNLTPEQAIAATLGRGECKLEQHGSLADLPSMVCWSCSECGYGWHHSINDKQFSYCPNCGRRVEVTDG